MSWGDGLSTGVDLDPLLVEGVELLPGAPAPVHCAPPFCPLRHLGNAGVGLVGQRFQRRPELVRYAKVYSGRIVGTPPLLSLCPPCHGGFPPGFRCDLVSPKIRRNGAIIKPRQGLIRRYVQGRNNCV